MAYAGIFCDGWRRGNAVLFIAGGSGDEQSHAARVTARQPATATARTTLRSPR